MACNVLRRREKERKKGRGRKLFARMQQQQQKLKKTTAIELSDEIVWHLSKPYSNILRIYRPTIVIF